MICEKIIKNNFKLKINLTLNKFRKLKADRKLNNKKLLNSYMNDY